MCFNRFNRIILELNFTEYIYLILAELMKLRNTLVHHIHNSLKKKAEKSHLSRLPDILTNSKTCQYCPQKRNCALYERYNLNNSLLCVYKQLM